MIDWDRRRRNIRILCAAHNVSATQVANEIDLSPNTLTKFLNAKAETNRTLSAKSLALVINYFGLTDEADLDTDNVLADPRAALRKLVERLTPEQAIALQRELEHRFPD